MTTSHVAGKQYRYPVIKVSMTDRDIIERVAAMFGNSVYDVPPARKFPDRLLQFRAQITGTGAAEWMERVRPWLGQRRRAKLDEVLTEYRQQEPTAVRRSRTCSTASAARARNRRGQFIT
jgi:hypothetical protein